MCSIFSSLLYKQILTPCRTAQGVSFEKDLIEDSYNWVFLWDHTVALEFLNEHYLDSTNFKMTKGIDARGKVHISYPARMCKTAGFRRYWGYGQHSSSTGITSHNCMNLLFTFSVIAGGKVQK